MFSTGAWANDADGVTTTGLDDVDLWVGGLAEVTNLFGGLLGSTFNYVFQNQLENLQDGDRLYYLARTPGMNLRTQLEGNSFAELIQRNTDGTNTLKADAFATADCKFQLGNLRRHRRRAAPSIGAGSVADDPTTTDCDENAAAAAPAGRHDPVPRRSTPSTRPASTARPSTTAPPASTGSSAATTTTPSGVATATTSSRAAAATTSPSAARATTSSPTSTAPTCPRAVPATTPSTAVPGDDILMGGDGKDFTNGGANDNETFAGAGNDFVIAGQGADAVFGDGGDDWIEGGVQPDLLQGDTGTVLRRPGNPPGNDILIGQQYVIVVKKTKTSYVLLRIIALLQVSNPQFNNN